MLEGIFGNKTAEKVLLHVFHFGEIYPSAIAQDYGLALDPVKRQLERFERVGVLVAKQVGRARVFSFNPKSAYAGPVKELVERLYKSIPLKEREKLFSVRRRPRLKGKPIVVRKDA